MKLLKNYEFLWKLSAFFYNFLNGITSHYLPGITSTRELKVRGTTMEYSYG